MFDELENDQNLKIYIYNNCNTFSKVNYIWFRGNIFLYYIFYIFEKLR